MSEQSKNFLTEHWRGGLVAGVVAVGAAAGLAVTRHELKELHQWPATVDNVLRKYGNSYLGTLFESGDKTERQVAGYVKEALAASLVLGDMRTLSELRAATGRQHPHLTPGSRFNNALLQTMADHNLLSTIDIAEMPHYGVVQETGREALASIPAIAEEMQRVTDRVSRNR